MENKGNNRSVSDRKFILSLDKVIQGYVDTEVEVKKCASELAESLISFTFKSTEEEPRKTRVRIFRETVNNSIMIYTQEQGYVFNGLVALLHTIEWNPIPKYSFGDRSSLTSSIE